METKPNHASPVLTDPAPVTESRLGIRSSLLPQHGAAFSSSKHIKILRKKPVILDDVRSNGWLDAMKASSPPRKNLVKDFILEVAVDDSDAIYVSWMVCFLSQMTSRDVSLFLSHM